MEEIILDTNFLLIPYMQKVDIFSEIERICDFPYKLNIVDKSLQELKKIKDEQSLKYGKAAKIAFELLKNKDINIIKTGEGEVDDIIVAFAKKGFIVATQDSELKKRARQEGARIIFLRQKKYIELI